MAGVRVQVPLGGKGRAGLGVWRAEGAGARPYRWPWSSIRRSGSWCRLPPEPESKGLGAGGGRQITGGPVAVGRTAHVCLSWRPDPRHAPLAWGFLICEMGT